MIIIVNYTISQFNGPWLLSWLNVFSPDLMILNDLNIFMATKKPKIWKFENLVNLSLTIVNVYEYLMSKIVKVFFKIQN